MLRGRSCWEAWAVLSQGQGTLRARPAGIQQSTREPLSACGTFPAPEGRRRRGDHPPSPHLLSSVTKFLGPNSRWQVAEDFHCGFSWHRRAQLGTCPSAHGQQVSVHFEDVEPITESWGKVSPASMAKPGHVAPPAGFPSGPSGWEEKLGVRNHLMQAIRPPYL